MKTKALFKTCSKGAAVLAALLCVTLFSCCSKDDEPETGKFSDDIQSVLNIIDGTFSGDEYFLGEWFRTDKLTFSPYEYPVEKTTFRDGTVTIHGTIYRVQNKSVGGEVIDHYFFLIDPLKSTIVMYGYNSENGEMNETKETLLFDIVDNNTIKLRDYGLTEDNWIVYSREL